MNISQKGIDLIKKFEGFSPNAYRCPAGKMTIGYGHVIQAERERFNAPLTEADAERILLKDVKTAEATINKGTHTPLTQGQYDALVSLVFNWGGSNFLRSQGLKYLNSYDYALAAKEFFSFDKGIVKVSGTVMPGLVKRRQAEWDLWNDKT
jgi:lysozyme